MLHASTHRAVPSTVSRRAARPGIRWSPPRSSGGSAWPGSTSCHRDRPRRAGGAQRPGRRMAAPLTAPRAGGADGAPGRGRGSLGGYVLRRLGHFGAVILAVHTLLLRYALPGDPVELMPDRRSRGAGASGPEQIAASRARYGLDRPPLVQCAATLGRFVTGDLGVSCGTGTASRATTPPRCRWYGTRCGGSPFRSTPGRRSPTGSRRPGTGGRDERAEAAPRPA